MKLLLRVLPIAIALLLPSVALAGGAKAGAKGRTHTTSHAKATPKKIKVKAPKKPAKASKPRAGKKPSAPAVPAPPAPKA